MIKKVLESFEACGIDYTKPMTSEDLVAVTGYCERLSEGAISYGKFMTKDLDKVEVVASPVKPSDENIAQMVPCFQPCEILGRGRR